jgi:hypothetical protein
MSDNELAGVYGGQGQLMEKSAYGLFFFGHHLHLVSTVWTGINIHILTPFELHGPTCIHFVVIPSISFIFVTQNSGTLHTVKADNLPENYIR